MRKKDLIELGITGVLVIIMILAFANAAKKARSRSYINNTQSLPMEQGLKVDSKVNKMDSVSPYDVLVKKADELVLKRDPFTGAVITADKKVEATLSLSGILWDKSRPLAVINGKIAKVGDRVDNSVIVDIKQDRVILSDGSGYQEVRLGQ